MGREEGGGFRMGNTWIPVADSFWYLAKLTQFANFKNKIKNLKEKKIKSNKKFPFKKKMKTKKSKEKSKIQNIAL